MGAKRFRTEGDVRKALEVELGFSLTEAEWTHLVEEAYVREILSGERTINRLANDVRKFISIWGGQQLPARTVAPMLGDKAPKDVTELRRHVLSDLLAKQAEDEDFVRHFRQEILAGKLLGDEEVAAWIEEQANRDGRATRYALIPLPESADIAVMPDGVSLKSLPESYPVVNLEARVLEYAIPGNAWVHRIPTAQDGVLDRLRVVSEHLAGRYPWQNAQATLFVLTGKVPLVQYIEASCRWSSRSVCSRITLTVDPTIKPDVVADYYSKIRRQMVRRHRPQTEKHLQLAYFAVTRPQDEKWSQTMDRWNQTYPQWKFADVDKFIDKCRDAQRRLLHPKFQIPI